MKKILSYAAALLLSLASVTTHARIVEIDFAVSFANSYSHLTQTWQPINATTIASVSFDVDAMRGGGAQYWQGELQSVDTYFGAPTITSPFITSLHMPSDAENWSRMSTSFSLATSIDYSISWPQTPFGKGPFVYYQMNEAWYGYKDGLTWDYIIGFNLNGPGIVATSIGDLSGDAILSYIALASKDNRGFSTGFNSRVYDSRTYQNLYGISYLGTATITGYSVSSHIPEPPTPVILLSGIPLMYLLRRRQR